MFRERSCEQNLYRRALMSRPNKDKVPTQAPAAGLFQAFAGLDLGGLPSGPAESAQAAPDAANQARLHSVKKGRVVLRRETAHRSGKTVVAVDGFEPGIADSEIEALAKKLKAVCGCGGCVKGRVIEIQGEQAARVREILVAEGFRVAGIQ